MHKVVKILRLTWLKVLGIDQTDLKLLLVILRECAVVFKPTLRMDPKTVCI